MGKTLEELWRNIIKIFKVLRKNNLYVKPKKCKFKQKEVTFLGYIMLRRILQIDPEKVKTVTDWSTLYNKKDIQLFLRFANYYYRFISRFAKTAQKLHTLTGKLPFC